MDFLIDQDRNFASETLNDNFANLRGGGDNIEGDWDDDEDFDDQLDAEDDLHEIQAGDDIGEPDPEEDDHLPDDDLQ